MAKQFVIKSYRGILYRTEYELCSYMLDAYSKPQRQVPRCYVDTYYIISLYNLQQAEEIKVHLLVVFHLSIQAHAPYSFGSKKAQIYVNGLLWFQTLVRFLSWEAPSKVGVPWGGIVGSYALIFSLCALLSSGFSLLCISAPIHCPAYHNPLWVWFPAPPLCPLLLLSPYT